MDAHNNDQNALQRLTRRLVLTAFLSFVVCAGLIASRLEAPLAAFALPVMPLYAPILAFSHGRAFLILALFAVVVSIVTIAAIVLAFRDPSGPFRVWVHFALFLYFMCSLFVLAAID